MFAIAMPMYFAVSRTTDIATPSPRRAPSNTCAAVIASSEPARSITLDSIPGLDAPRQPAGDTVAADFSGEVAELAVILPFDGIEGEPGGGSGETVSAEPGCVVQHEPGDHAIPDHQADRIASADGGADPGFGHNRRGSGRADQRNAAIRRPARARRLPRQPPTPHGVGPVSGRELVQQCAHAGFRAVTSRPAQHLTLVVHRHTARGGVPGINPESEHQPPGLRRAASTTLRPSSGSAPAPSTRNSDWSTRLSCCLRRRSSGAQNTITPAPSPGGKVRSSM